ncbi:hypothetical protein [Microbacterium arborescens]|uniref:hypothetical protein n=1 Tax=Microbacterium arborescens TaxID=33883 RepID=UPI003C767FF1
MTFEVLLAIAATTLGAFAALVTQLSSAVNLRAAKRQLDRLKGLRVDEVLRDPSVRSLGGLLVDDLGKTSLPSYVRDPVARTEFRRAFNAVREYVGTDAEILDRDEPSNQQQGFEDSNAVWSRPLTTAGQRAISELNSGETWNALALMRRAVETTLAERMPISEAGRPRVGAGRLAGLAAKQGIISAQVATELRYPISVANAAIHGEEVGPDAALEAISIMDRAINEIVGATN